MWDIEQHTLLLFGVETVNLLYNKLKVNANKRWKPKQKVSNGDKPTSHLEWKSLNLECKAYCVAQAWEETRPKASESSISAGFDLQMRMRRRGNHIQAGQVLVVFLVALLVLLLYLTESSNKYHIADYDDAPAFVATESYGGVSTGRSVNDIGPQRSSQKEAQVRQLNQQMYRLLELTNIE